MLFRAYSVGNTPTMPTYYLDLPDDSSPRAWSPHEGPRPERPDTRYFGQVFTHMEKALIDPDLEVYLTWSVDQLPSYGARTVAVLLGDEAGRIPRYVDRVRAVFKCYGSRPVLGPVEFDVTGVLAVLQWSYRWLRWLPGAAAHGSHRLGRALQRQRLKPGLFTIPPGTYNQLELPLEPIGTRPTDLFFAGSIEHRGSARRLASPKEHARRGMLDAVARLGQQRPELQLDIQSTPSFKASAEASPQIYSKALMDSKVCLAPRGTSLETFRVLEGLRYGCVVVSERLPRRWFYEDAPILQLERWADLHQALTPVLDNPSELEDRHRRALAWWRDRCSEAAVGSYLAHCLNTLSGRETCAS